MRLVKYLVLALVLGYTAEWVPINLLLASLGKDKPPLTLVKNDELTRLIEEKTQVKIDTVKISESDRPFGMMIGIPGRPQLVLSRGLYDTFNLSETEYVVLHETGHYQLAHTIKELLFGLSLLILGVYLLKKVKNQKAAILLAALVGVFLGVMFIQLGKLHEIYADRYALKRITDPQGMIAATGKFSGYYGTKYTQSDNLLLHWLFYRANPYDNRIKMAKKEIARRIK
jgi:Zn-dependent protease with chaperone function